MYLKERNVALSETQQTKSEKQQSHENIEIGLHLITKYQFDLECL